MRRRIASMAAVLVAIAVILINIATAEAQQISFAPSVSQPQQTEFTVELGLTAAGLSVVGVEVVVQYDPAIVRLDGIDAGSWFTAHGVQGSSFFFHDFTPEAAAGELRFGAALLGESSAEDGQLAVCRFTAIGPGESPLTFVEMRVRGPLNEDLGFAHSTDDLIRIDVGQLYFDPATSTPVTSDFTVDLAIGAAGYLVKGAEVVVSFDPAIVTLTDITPGDWVTSQGLQYYFYDYTEPDATEIHFAMSFLDGSATGSGVLAVCHFSAAAVGESPLVFVSVDVRDSANQELWFEHSDGDRIVIDPVIPTEAATLGGVKAGFR